MSFNELARKRYSCRKLATKAGFAYGGLVPKGRLADQYLARFTED